MLASSSERITALLACQKAAFARQRAPSAAVRIDRLDRAIRLLAEHGRDFTEALAADFGWRSKDMSMLTDVAAAIQPLRHARERVRDWMRPERRSVQFPLGLLGARAEVRFEPKGVVGIMAPWNFPVNLIFAPLAGVLAAGNRALIKPSELAPATADLVERTVRLHFDDEEVAVVTGGPDVGEAFAKAAFDHLVFTGGEGVGRKVLRAAAENLTPVTLELGGKCPVILARDCDLAVAAARIMAGKTLNAGQVCLAPDYVLAPREHVEAFVEAARAATAAMYPKLRDNPDYTAIINDRHFARLSNLREDARAKGARVLEINPGGESFARQPQRRMPPTALLDVTDDMAVMREEIFGPLLPIVPYDAIDEAISYVNARPHPLALYYFGDDPAGAGDVIRRTRSGGVAINDVVAHVAEEDLPFGGIGPSGMGVYHGHDGFLEFSHRRAVYRQARSEIIARIRPPYDERFRDFLKDRLK